MLFLLEAIALIFRSQFRQSVPTSDVVLNNTIFDRDIYESADVHVVPQLPTNDVR